MNYYLDFRYRRALQPDGLATIATATQAVVDAMQDARNAGIDPARDPGTILLARHVGRIALGHATGSSKRLNRQFGKRFGDDAFAFEEIVASLTQATLCAEYGLPNELHDSHASYIHHWMKILRGDKTAILYAAAKAEQAVKWLRQFDPALAGELKEAA